jgi:two-component system nitrogen regulation sensor histidine kinase NtrY
VTTTKNNSLFSLDPREAAKRNREKLLILGVAVLFALTTYFEIRLSNLSSRLPFVNSIFFFGLINFNIILLMVLVFLIFRNIGKLFLERRRRILGSRLKTKLVLAFLSFTIIPTVILFLISSLYINSSFDKWFSIKVQNTMQATLEITQTYYKNTSRIAQHLATQTASELIEKYGHQQTSKRFLSDAQHSRSLRKFVERTLQMPTVDGVEVYTDPLDERVLASTQADPEHTIPRLPLDVLNKAFAGDSASLVQHMRGSDLIRAVAPMMDRTTGKVQGAVAITFLIPVSLVNKVDEISSVFQDYRDVNPLKYPVKSTYFIILLMMTLLVIFVCIWIGLYLARELTVPLERLVTATRRISQGNLDFEVINPGSDEIAHLTSSFNTMTGELKRHRLELEEKRAYVEAILNNVAAGVISVNAAGVIMTSNPSAAKLLGFQPEQLVNRDIHAAFEGTPFPIAEMFTQLQARSPSARTPLQRQFASGGADETALYELMATASSFGGGVVFVIDDMSHLSKAQREAAWREVARRIAHEIKNPLTPIKLSAQRLQKKFASQTTSEAGVFRECTDTIIKNVDELRDMVNEFSSFARFPSAKPTKNNLNEALRETIVLYEEAHRSISFVFESEARMPLVDFDRDQIKRVMINLLDNSVAALAVGVGQKMTLPKKITIRTHYNEQLQLVAIEMEDNGPGMAEAVSRRVFEPYFSTKSEGTGLGLAIVKRIISDHQGFIRVQSGLGEGTKFTIELPINLLENEYVRERREKWPELYS